MPTYEYICPVCQLTKEYQHKMNEELRIICLDCFHNGIQSKLEKGFGGGTAVHFKGSGFYETDGKRK